MENTEYVSGFFTEKEGNYGNYFTVALKLEDLKAHVDEKGYVRFLMTPKKTPGKFGDNWKATYSNKKENKDVKQGMFGKSVRSMEETVNIDNIPF